MIRNYVDLFVRSQLPNGELPLIAGANQPSEGMALMMHPMRTAIWMAQYALWTKDTDYVRAQIVPVLLKYRDYWKGRNNPDGLVVVRTKAGSSQMEQTWIDWSSNEWQTNFRPGPGGDSVLVPWNLLYAEFLEVWPRCSTMWRQPPACRRQRTSVTGALPTAGMRTADSIWTGGTG